MSNPATQEPSVGDFLRAIKPASERDLILATCYYIEVLQGTVPFRTGDVKQAVRTAKQRAPSNISRALVDLARDGALLVSPRGLVNYYELAQPTIDRLAQRLTDAGWLSTTPRERIEIIREVSQSLGAALARVSDERERDYVEEALSCLNPEVSAYRAAIVLGWSAAMWNLRKKLDRNGLAAFNAAFARKFPKSKRPAVQVLEDFEEYRDSEILQVAEALNVISQATHKILRQHLDIRNNSGHPTDYRPELHRVKTFFEELINHVLAVP
jgi:hypothetical protein